MAAFQWPVPLGGERDPNPRSHGRRRGSPGPSAVCPRDALPGLTSDPQGTFPQEPRRLFILAAGLVRTLRSWGCSVKVARAPAGGCPSGDELPSQNRACSRTGPAPSPGLSLVPRRHVASQKVHLWPVVAGILPLCSNVLLTGGSVNAEHLPFLFETPVSLFVFCFLSVLECRPQPGPADALRRGKAASHAAGRGCALGAHSWPRAAHPSWACDDTGETKRVHVLFTVK